MSSPSAVPLNDPKESRTPEEVEPEQDAGEKEKGKESAVDGSSASLSVGAWQAIFSPQYNAYYFYNGSTGETTWVNPLQPSPDQDTQEHSPDESVDPYDPNSLEARAIAAGIDPSLAHLDPTLAGPSSVAHAGSFSAKFNARTGAFTAADARAPSHLSEYERMKRMSQFYFDVGAWEREVEDRDAAEKAAGGKKRKKPTKKDLERFKQQKKLKKIAKTAWLRT